ncbi:hypothetical protein [Pseudomonas mosselii]|nr:hypothetical protein [Pseudomonas mosselii]MCL8303075.1 hypothetical protein [Pseudomonas mosselii]
MTRVGTMLAEHMEGGGVVLNGESDSDKFLVGGGKLISSMILGIASGRKGSGGNEAKKPTTTPVELPGGGKGVIDGTKGGGTAGQKLPSALPENLTGYANPKDIRFTQDSVSNNFKDRKRGQIYFSCSSFDPVVEKGSNSHAGQVESRV